MRPVRIVRTLLLCVATFAASGLPASAEGDPFLRRTATVRAVERVGPSVVNITTEQRVRARSPFQPFLGGPAFDRFFQDFFEPRRPSQRSSLGSGVVIDRHGHVLTNEHVVAAADAIRVTLADGREFDATLVGADPNNDLAVLELVDADAVPWVVPGSSDDLMVGEPVIAIGNPFGLSNTVTTGVLSALDRSIRSDDRVFHGFLQTDASINPGNSGGPLLNAAGDLVGVNTAIYQGAEGIGFAIPIDVAKRIVRELITHGELAPVWLGLDLQDLAGPLAELMELPEATAGALVSRVRPESPAAVAGVARGDVVTAIDGHDVRTAREYYEMLERSTTGQTLAVTVQRGAESRVFEARAATFPDTLVQDLGARLLGVDLAAGPRGFQVASVHPRGGSARIGVEPGDVFLAVNGRALEDSAAFRRAVLDLRGRPRARVVVQRGRGRYHVTIPLGE